MERPSRTRVLLYVVLFAMLFLLATSRGTDRGFAYLLLFLILVFFPFAFVGMALFAVFRRRGRLRVPSLLGGAGGRPMKAPRLVSPVFIALVMIVCGLGSFFGLRNWFFRPVDQAISLRPGTIRTNFRVMKEDEYFISVVVDRTNENDPACPTAPDWQYKSVVNARWTVFKDGQPDASRLLNSGQFENTDVFELSPGLYRLELEVLSDASCLQRFHPRLVVETDRYEYGTWSVLSGWSSLLCCAAGVVVLGSVVVRRRRETRVTKGVAGVEHVGPVIYQPFRRRPLREKFSGLPAFGTVAALVMFTVLVPMWLLTSWRYVPKGLTVRVSSRDYSKALANPLVGPLIVSVERYQKTVRYRIDGKVVPEENLRDQLKKALSPRPDWIVFVEGDDDLPYQDVVYVIDVASGLHAKAVMLTPAMKEEVEKAEAKARSNARSTTSPPR